jgi:Peptidase propeptide and YPEB domain
MKTKMILGCALALGLAAWGMVGCVSESAKQAKLEAKAKISKVDAQKTALAKVPNGTVKEAEIEEEKGILIWSFDIATPDSKDITEVGVNAMTGEIVSVEKETPEQEKKESGSKTNK